MLRREMRGTRDASRARRLLALAAIYDGNPRGEAAKIGGVTLQIVRDRVVRFNAEGPAGLIDRKAPGSAPKLGAAERQALAQMVARGPVPAVHGVVRWRRVDLAQRVWEEFRISISTQTPNRALRALGDRKLSARPRDHAQDPRSLETFKRTSPPRWRRSRRTKPLANP
jgi:transposase